MRFDLIGGVRELGGMSQGGEEMWGCLRVERGDMGAVSRWREVF